MNVRKDRRIRRTREALQQALVAMLIESPYDSITVQQILDRANVGRSTFYAHFEDKDELLVSAIDELYAAHLKKGDAAMFEHVQANRKVYRALVATPVWPLIRKRMEDALADRVRRDWKPRRSKIAPELVAQYVASTFVSVLTWWLERRTGKSPVEADALFRELIANGTHG